MTSICNVTRLVANWPRGTLREHSRYNSVVRLIGCLKHPRLGAASCHYCIACIICAIIGHYWVALTMVILGHKYEGNAVSGTQLSGSYLYSYS